VRDLRALPKTDLHLHFQGSVRVATLRDLTAKHGCDLPPGLDGDRYTWKDFTDFIRQYGVVCNAVREPGDYERVAVEICDDLSRQGVRYAEVTLTTRDASAVAASLDGFDEGFERFGVRCRLVLDHVRGFPVESAERVLELALAHRDRGVVAIGLGGPEAQPGAPAASVFQRALAEGLHSVPHAGEAMGPESIREALDLLGAERLGHGFRVLEDEALTAEVRERGIPLEVCPTSNVATRIIDRLEEHPLPRLIEAGVVVTLNSDDPAMFASPVLGEYEVARTIFGMPDEALAALARAGVQASYADERTKQDMERGIDAWIREEA
jgi:adenosine deaminase